MEILHAFEIGVSAMATPMGISMLFLGVVLGICIGATPGMSPSMGVALLVPFSYGMDPVPAFILFVAAYQAANYGGSITAIAVNTPGTPSSVVTAIDGYELSKQGKPGLALGTAVICSSAGGMIGALILILCAGPIASVALAFGPAAYFSLAVFGLTTVVALGKSSPWKAAAGIFLGLLLNSIRMDPFSGLPRFSFGEAELYDGITFIPAMIGLFALAEMFLQLESKKKAAQLSQDFQGALPPWASIKGVKNAILRSSLLGTFIGVIPGAGSTIASFISYGIAKQRSSKPEEFGHGSLEGIAASEAANSSSVGGALVPLLALGIPGSATDAVLLGALTLHGLVAGPELFQSDPALVYGILASLVAANALIFVVGLLGNKLWLQVIRIPRPVLTLLIINMCFLGSYSVRNSVFDMWVCLVFGLLGWLLKRYGFQPAGVVLGLVLGTLLEDNFRRTLLMGGPSLFFTDYLSATLLLLSFASLALPLLRILKSQS